jgi:phosphomevalonate kinase
LPINTVSCARYSVLSVYSNGNLCLKFRLVMTVVSSPGKVLIAGGYLVLDPAYAGVVVSTSSRFYTVIQDATAKGSYITVRSPQFLNAAWTYSVTLDPSALVEELPTK